MRTASTLGKKSYSSSPIQHPLSTKLNAAARRWGCRGLDVSSQEGTNLWFSPRQRGATAGTTRLLGHRSWIQILFTNGVRHAAVQACCCYFAQILDRGTGPWWICLGLMDLNSLHGLLCSIWELLFCSPTMPGTRVCMAQPFATGQQVISSSVPVQDQGNLLILGPA